MVRLGISVEGITEERFVKSVLYDHLMAKGIFIEPINMKGNVSLARIKHELRQLVYDFDKITTFYDFYGFHGKTTNETKQSLEDKILNSITPSKQNDVIPYVQMYEFEGLLFTSPTILAQELVGNSKDSHLDLTLWSTNILRQFSDDPEQINNSVLTAPSKRLEAHTNYIKTIDGPKIAKSIGIEELKNKCQGFRIWMEKIESLSPLP